MTDQATIPVTPDSALTHYVDLSLLPDPEFPANQLMNALYAKLHRALCDLREADPDHPGVGVSFPAHSQEGSLGLGTCLRLHGPAHTLALLMEQAWLKGMRDHLAQAQPLVQAVPPHCLGHRLVHRVQVQSSPERLRRRWLKRHGGETFADEAAQRYPDQVAQRLRLPYLQLRSRSTGQQFLLFIQHGPVLPEPVQGSFSNYGLSLQGSTVPWF